MTSPWITLCLPRTQPITVYLVQKRCYSCMCRYFQRIVRGISHSNSIFHNEWWIATRIFKVGFGVGVSELLGSPLTRNWPEVTEAYNTLLWNAARYTSTWSNGTELQYGYRPHSITHSFVFVYPCWPTIPTVPYPLTRADPWAIIGELDK